MTRATASARARVRACMFLMLYACYVHTVKFYIVPYTYTHLAPLLPGLPGACGHRRTLPPAPPRPVRGFRQRQGALPEGVGPIPAGDDLPPPQGPTYPAGLLGGGPRVMQGGGVHAGGPKFYFCTECVTDNR